MTAPGDHQRPQPGTEAYDEVTNSLVRVYLPPPSEVRDELRRTLPGSPHVEVTPRNAAEQRCPAYLATHYEVAAYFTEFGASLLPLHVDFTRRPEVYRVTYMGVGRELEPEWPVKYRDRNDKYRPQVRALWRPAS